MLCGYHHRLIHDDGWRMIAAADGTLTFIRPDGHELESQPPSLRPEIRERFFGSGPSP
jgi:hypothetical protein